MDFFLQQRMPRSDASTIVDFVPQKGHYGVAHVCGDPDKRAVLDDRPNRAEPTSPPRSISVAAHNPTYARHTTAQGLVAFAVAPRLQFTVVVQRRIGPRRVASENPTVNQRRAVTVQPCGWSIDHRSWRTSAAPRLPPRVPDKVRN